MLSKEERGKRVAVKEGFSEEASRHWVLAHKDRASLNQEELKRRAAKM